MRDDGWVHQCRCGIGIFVAEIGPDQFLPSVREFGRVELQQSRDFNPALSEQGFYLQMTFLELRKQGAVYLFSSMLVERGDIVDQLECAVIFGILGLPTQMERLQYDA